LAFTALSLVFSGCEKDDGGGISDARLVGKWGLTSWSYLEYENNVKIDEDIETDFSSDDYWEFKPDGSVTLSETGAGIEQGNYTFTDDGKKLTLTASLNGITISLPYTVKTLTSTDMTLHHEFTSTESGKSYREVNEVTFKKK
jgi:hypothetical protein